MKTQTVNDLKVGDNFRFPESSREVHTVTNRTKNTIHWTIRRGGYVCWNNGTAWNLEIAIV